MISRRCVTSAVTVKLSGRFFVTFQLHILFHLYVLYLYHLFLILLLPLQAY